MHCRDEAELLARSLWMRRSPSTQAQSTASHCRLTSPTGQWLFTDAQQGLLWLAAKLHQGHAIYSWDILNGWILSGQPTYITYTDDRELLTEQSTFKRYCCLRTAESVSPGWNITHAPWNNSCALLQNYYILFGPQQLHVTYDIIFSIVAVRYILVTFQDLPNKKSISYFTDDFKLYETIISI